MGRWFHSFASLRPGVVRPGHVTRGQVFLAAADPHSRPYFAPLAVLLVVQPTVYDSLSRAFQRVAGVVAGVAAALAISHFLAPSGWSIGIIVFAGLLAGWAARLGPQGVVQIPVSALLVFLVGRVTPGYGASRIADTLIGAAVAVIAVLLTPSAPGPDAVVSRALAPLRRCAEILRAMSTGIGSPWTPEQAQSWRRDALTLADAVAAARRDHEGHRLSTRWNARARRDRAAMGRADQALLSGERISASTRSIARALADGSAHARPMPTVSAMLAQTASATEAYTAWLASPGTPAHRRPLAAAVHAADDALSSTLARAQERWGSNPAQWLTFGTTLAMSQRILAETGQPLDPAERDPA